MIYSILFTAHPVTGWKTIGELNSYKGYSYDSFDNSIAKKIYPLISNYYLNLDVGGYMALAHDFPNAYFRGKYTFLTRPLYTFIVHVVSLPLHLVSNSYSTTFLAGLFVNFVLFFFTVLLFYLLIKKIVSSRIAFLSSILLIFSPFAHAWLVQPETNIFGAFELMLSLYFIYDYVKNPSSKKLIIFSLIIGTMMLGKKFLAISFFILILSVYFKRYKEGIIFFLIHAVPFLLWSLWITKVWNLHFYVDEVSFGVGIWFLDILKWPWDKVMLRFLGFIPSFINSILYGFLMLPPIFAMVGFPKLQMKNKNIIVFGLIASFFMLFFASTLYIPRHAFLLFPIVYPLTVLGIDKIAGFFERYKKGCGLAVTIAIFMILIAISSVNIFKVFPYDTFYFPYEQSE